MNVDLLITVDTTGSMYPVIHEVRARLDEALEVFSEISGLRVGIVAHGDYADEARTYFIKNLGLTNDISLLRASLNATGATNGYDYAEAYEAVLHHVATNTKWRKEAEKVLVMIGDAYPHQQPPETRRHGWNDDERPRYDWRAERQAVLDQGVTIHSVQCLNQPLSDYFWKGLVYRTNGARLRLNQFQDVVDIIKSIALYSAEPSLLERYEAKLKKRSTLTRGTANAIDALLGRVESTAVKMYGAASDEIAVDDKTFQALTVPYTMSIKDMVQASGATFKTGRGFYDLHGRTDSQTVREKNDVILRHKSSGDLITGERAREMIGVPYGTRDNITPRGISSKLPQYEVYIQSTSYNRKLPGGTTLLYEATPEEIKTTGS